MYIKYLLEIKIGNKIIKLIENLQYIRRFHFLIGFVFIFVGYFYAFI